jgi:pyruvate dehydrogenase E1 component alpha subunit
VSSRKPGLGRGLEALLPGPNRSAYSSIKGETPSHGGGGDATFNLIDPDGTVHDRLPITLENLKALYADMVEARIFDEKSTAMQMQGRLATYSPFRGQEAAQIGAAAALAEDDWLTGTYRDAALNWRAGYPWRLLMAWRTGDERGGEVPEGVNILPPSITVGAHMLHAVGLSWAEKLQGNNRIALTSFGDGATSEGDFHEAMNFAAVFHTPTVFLCQNNGYAISHPTAEQTRAETIAGKAVGYGMPGIRVDGNDVVGMLVAVREAVDRARAGNGPSLIEAVTYRVGRHTTADDPSRYRDAQEAADWEKRDPLIRVRLLLEKADSWSHEWQEELEAGASERIEEAVAWAEDLPAPTLDDMLGRMSADG